MSPNSKPTGGQPDYPAIERRRQQPRGRRETDIENADIVEHAVQDAPIVHRILRTGRVAAAVGACCTLIGGATGAFGYRLVGPPDMVEKNAAMIVANRRDLDTLQIRYKVLNDKLDVLQRLSCLDPRISQRDRDLAGLDCTDLLARPRTP